MARHNVGAVLSGVQDGEGVRSYDVRDLNYPGDIAGAMKRLVGRIPAIGDQLFPTEAIQDAVTQKTGIVMSGAGMPKRVPAGTKNMMDPDQSDSESNAHWNNLELRRQTLVQKALAALTPKATQFKFPKGERLQGIIDQLPAPEEISPNRHGRFIASITPEEIGVAVNLENMRNSNGYHSQAYDSQNFKEFSAEVARKSGNPQVEKWQSASIGIRPDGINLNLEREHFVYKLADYITGAYHGTPGLKQALIKKYFTENNHRFTVQIPTYSERGEDLHRLVKVLCGNANATSYSASCSSLFECEFCLKGKYKGLFVFYFDQDAYEAQNELQKMLGS